MPQPHCKNKAKFGIGSEAGVTPCLQTIRMSASDRGQSI